MAKKSSEVMTVTLPGSGRQLEVPRGLTGSALRTHVEKVLAAEAEAASQAEAAAHAAARERESKAAAQESELAALREQVAALTAQLQETKTQNEGLQGQTLQTAQVDLLKTASDTMAVNALYAAEAKAARKEIEEVRRYRAENAEEYRLIQDSLAAKDRINAELHARNKVLFERASRGDAAAHAELEAIAIPGGQHPQYDIDAEIGDD